MIFSNAKLKSVNEYLDNGSQYLNNGSLCDYMIRSLSKLYFKKDEYSWLLYFVYYITGAHAATNWLPFDGSQNSIFRLSFKPTLSLNVFLSKIWFYHSPVKFYLIQIEKVWKNCWKTLYQNYEISTYD